MSALFCAKCGKDSRFAPFATVARLVGVSRATIYNWNDQGFIHCCELPNGRKLVCLQSLNLKSAALISSKMPRRDAR